MNAAEVAGGWCLLLPGDVPNPPEAFPTSFFDEHFWFAANASMTPATGGRALLVLAVEAAFAADVVPGGQIAFARVRVVLNPVPVTGTYRFIHPYGEQVIEATAGDRIFFTDDVGINCPPGQFDCATQGAVGPFLLPAITPGGPELPAITGPVPGKLYIADPARVGPVTGSALPNFTDSTGKLRNHNIYRIEGPVGSHIGTDPVSGALVDYLETSDFSLMGRVFTGTLPGRVTVERATYERDPATGNKLDVFATAEGTAQGRRPAQPRPATVVPQLSFFDAACSGTVDPVTGEVLPPFGAPVAATETQMIAMNPGMYWAQLAPAAIPAAVCVKDLTARNLAGAIVPVFHPYQVSDDVTITSALFDRAAGTLTVNAESTDKVVPPKLTLTYGTFSGVMNAGTLTVPNLLSPPSRVRVRSSAFGTNEQHVRTTLSTGTPAGLTVAVNDTFTMLEDAPLTPLNVLANDTAAAGGTVTLTALPRLGTATVNLDGTVGYKPNLNASGADQFSYTVTVAGKVSNVGVATINITPVNDPPTAVNDSATAIANVLQAINVIANDTDPDGAADIVGATNVTQPVGVPAVPGAPAPTGATVTVAGGVVSFRSPVGGTFTFTYNAIDTAGAISANAATVTVQVAASETVSITRSEYVASKGRLRAQGLVTPAAGQTITIEFLSSTGAVLGLAGTATPDAAGNWAVDAVVARPAAASRLRATSSNGTATITTLTLK